jgi:3-oxoacyl-(acyl-carrier-protein) synthase III
MPISARIAAVGRYLPVDTVSSAEVEHRVSHRSGNVHLPIGTLELLTGVASRHYARDDEASSDLAVQAARRAIEAAAVDPGEIDLLIFAAASHDVAEPATANIVQAKLGCGAASVLDVKNACNSFLNALDIAAAYVESGRFRCVLIASGEKLSPTICWELDDRRALRTRLPALTLGDGAGSCVVVGGQSTGSRILKGGFTSDGSAWRASTVLSGGTLMWGDVTHRFFECNSAQLERLACEHLPPLVTQVLSQVGWSLNDLDLIVPHQVSLGVIERICSAVGIDSDRCVVTLRDFGNMAAASIPVALSVANDDGRLSRGMRVLLVGGAAGFSGAVVPLIW